MRLEFELAYYDVEVYYVSHYVTETTLEELGKNCSGK